MSCRVGGILGLLIVTLLYIAVQWCFNRYVVQPEEEQRRRLITAAQAIMEKHGKGNKWGTEAVSAIKVDEGKLALLLHEEAQDEDDVSSIYSDDELNCIQIDLIEQA